MIIRFPFFFTMDDIIFEHREKRYGAYFLRKNIHWHEWVALALVCGWVWGAYWAWNLRKVESAVVYANLEADLVFLPIAPIPPPPLKKYDKNKITCFFEGWYFIPEPAPKECACDLFLLRHELEEVEYAESIRDSSGTITYITQSCECKDDIFNSIPPEIEKSTPQLICDCEYVDVTLDSALTPDLFYQPPAINETAQLINPEIIPNKIRKKLKKEKIKLSVHIDASGNYLGHRLEGRMPQRLEEQLYRFITELKFTPEIQQGKPEAVWVDL